MKIAHPLSYSAENPILVEHFTRLNQVVKGVIAVDTLLALKDYLANNDGEICYRLEGHQSSDGFDSKSGGKRRVKCIITGCIFVFGAVGEPLAHVLEITNHWVLVGSEQDLPALDEESDDEDYIVSGAVLDVPSLIAEEILLDIPMTALRATKNVANKHQGKRVTTEMELSSKPNPFAMLAALKKQN